MFALLTQHKVRYLQIRKARTIKEIAEKQKSTLSRQDITLNHAIGKSTAIMKTKRLTILIIGRGASGVVYTGMFRGTEVAVKRIIVNEISAAAMQEFELETAVMAYLFFVYSFYLSLFVLMFHIANSLQWS